LLYTSADPGATIKISDFGLAKVISNTLMTTACGTPGYVGKISNKFFILCFLQNFLNYFTKYVFVNIAKCFFFVIFNSILC